MNTYNEDRRTATTSRWYDENPAIDGSLLTKTYLGFVRNSADPQNMGRLLVWIPELTGDANKEKNWIICHYCSPFGGATFPRNNYYTDDTTPIISDYYGDGSNNGLYSHRTPEHEDTVYGGRQSYGLWLPPPDIGNQVMITFVNGDINFGVWFGVLFQQDMNHMIPGIAKGDIYNGGTSDEVGPVIEPDYMHTPGDIGALEPLKKAYTPLRDGLKNKQGLDKDDVRGQSTSSARRESPSEVFGVLTPDGNQFVMDDKQEQEFIRMRTKSGAQILVHQTEGMIYAISRDGKSWIELGNDGNIDVYGSENISIHAEKANVNVKSGQDINVQAARNLNMKIGGDYILEVGGDIDVKCDGDYTGNSVGKTSIDALGQIGITSGAEMGLTSGAKMSLQGGPIIELNTAPGPQANGTVAPASHPTSGPTTETGGTDSSWESGEPYATGVNIVPRVPQHEPWLEHQLTTKGTNNNVEEGPVNTKIPKGATSETAKKPIDITLPDARRFEGKSISVTKQPEYIQIENVPDCALATITQRQISDAGLDFIKQAEGSDNTVYKDQAGLDTIGVGHLITKQEKADGTFSSGVITDDEMNTILLNDLASTQKSVRGCVKQPVTQEQYDSMVSLAFNIGNSGFCNSTLVKKINAGEYQEVPNQMLRWNKIRVNGGAVVSDGLTNRRRAEANIFAKAPAPC